MTKRPLYTEVSMLELERLLDDADRGALALPDFQRDFVWSTRDVKSLLATVFSGWPAGTLLLTRGDLNQFRLRALDGAPPLRDVNHVILDGQQRLTALYSALRGTGDTVYAIDFSLVLDGSSPSIEERIRAIPSEEWHRRYSRPQDQHRSELLPLTALRSPSEFFEWRDSILQFAGDDDHQYLRDALTELYKDELASIHRYGLPAVLLESSLDITDVASIFEKVNRSGMQLNTFDLMVARVYDSSWNLREEWERARIDRPLVDSFLGGDAMPLLQAIALRRVGDVRQRAILELRGEVREDWSSIVQACEEACELLVSIGVEDPAWLPYPVQLVGLTALAMDLDLEIYRDYLVQWFWNTSFGQSYEVAANTRIVADYRRLAQLEPELPIRLESEVLRTATRRANRALWGATLALMAGSGGVDVLGYERERRSNLSPLEGGAPRRYVVSMLSRDPLDPSSSHLWVPTLLIAGRRSASQIRRLGLVRSVAIAASDPDVVEHLGEALGAQFLPPADVILDPGMSGADLVDLRFDNMVASLRRNSIHVF